MDGEEFSIGEKFTNEVKDKSIERNNQESQYTCAKCRDTGIVKEADGSCHTCWDCLEAGRLDCHSKDLPDVNIKL